MPKYIGRFEVIRWVDVEIDAEDEDDFYTQAGDLDVTEINERGQDRDEHVGEFYLRNPYNDEEELPA